MSPAQRRAYDALMPRFGIEFAAKQIDLDAVFGRGAPKILDIGFGMGETTARLALAHPGNDYLGVEVHTPGVGGLLKLIEEKSIANLRIIQHDVVEVLEHMIAPASLSGAQMFFPDPWPKKRHHKRRLIQPAFIALLSDRLKSGGFLHVATDWEAYAQHAFAVLSAEAMLTNTCADFAPRPDSRPLTKFEQRGVRLGHQVWDLIFRKR
jgi:tRNA (guanine-N7-)-methyltransferase